VPAGVGAVRTLLAALRRGELVGILPDQDAGTGLGVFAPFFGQPTNTMLLLPRLAAHTRALVVIVYAERLSREGSTPSNSVTVTRCPPSSIQRR